VIRLYALIPLIAASQLGNPPANGARWEMNVVARREAWIDYPQMSDGRIVWSEQVGGNHEVFLFDSGTITQLTENDVDDVRPDLAGENIAWLQHLVGEHPSFTDDVYRIQVNGKTVADGLEGVYDLHVAREGVAWSQSPDRYAPSTIFFYDGAETKSLSLNGTWANHNPQISGECIVWSGFDERGNHAYLYNGSEITQLPDRAGIGQTPQMYGNYVTGLLVNSDGLINGVTRYDLSTGRLVEFPLENRFYGVPIITAGFMTWVDYVDGRYGLLTLHGDKPIRLTGERESVNRVLVTDALVAWTNETSQGLVFVYDGTGTSSLENVAAELVDADGSTLLLLRHDGAATEIVTATLLVPEPTCSAIVGAALIVLARRRVR
jgi:hypothetical protein